MKTTKLARDHEPLTAKDRESVRWLRSVLNRVRDPELFVMQAWHCNLEDARELGIDEASINWKSGARLILEHDCGTAACVLGYASAYLDEVITDKALLKEIKSKTSMPDHMILRELSPDNWPKANRWIIRYEWGSPDHGGTDQNELEFAKWRLDYALEHGWPSIAVNFGLEDRRKIVVQFEKDRE